MALYPMQGEKFKRSVQFDRRLKGNKKGKIKRNKHHMTNACKGGKTTPNNILIMKVERHASLHRYFRNMSWEEIGDVLYSIFHMRDPAKCYEVVQRLSRLKGRVA